MHTVTTDALSCHAPPPSLKSRSGGAATRDNGNSILCAQSIGWKLRWVTSKMWSSVAYIESYTSCRLSTERARMSDNQAHPGVNKFDLYRCIYRLSVALLCLISTLAVVFVCRLAGWGILSLSRICSECKFTDEVR